MSYDRTLLYSGTAGVSSCVLSEPASAFEHIVIGCADGNETECTIKQTTTAYKLPINYGSWSTEAYMVWPYNLNISNSTKTITLNRFQMLMQVGTAAPKCFGFGNSAANIKKIKYVYGINHIIPIEITGAGYPEGECVSYNETLLWSGDNTLHQSEIPLTEPANNFERLKVRLGTLDAIETNYTYDVGIPTDSAAYFPLHSYWGNNTGSYYFCNHRYKFNGYDKLQPISGKAFQLGANSNTAYTATGYLGSNTFVNYPLNAIWGINRK